MLFTLCTMLIWTAVPLFALWMAGLLFLAWRSAGSPRPAPPETEETPFFSIIVPAHNEQEMIAGTAEKILAFDYPEDRFALYVVADNCTDDTAERARRAGANVLERTDAVNKGKGHALAHALEQIKQKGGTSDAILFLDADSSPNKDYLRVMARYIVRGDGMIQGRYDVDGPDRTWFTRLTSVSFVLRNRWQFPAVDALGLTLPLRGSGMCFAAPVIDRIGWTAHGLTEDTEMTLRLIRDGVRVSFAPDAVSRQFMPGTPKEAVTQRLRWSAGERGVRSTLLKQEIPWAVGQKRWRDALSLLLMAAPPFSLQLCAAVLLAAAAWFTAESVLRCASIAVVAGYGGYFLLGVERLDRRGIQAVLMLPAFVLWRVGVYALACVRKPISWVRTPRSPDP